MFKMTRKQLLKDLHGAWRDASRGKTSRADVRDFTRHLERNLCDLRDELWSRTYKRSRSRCFAVNDSAKREILAAAFRDCVVDHLYYNYVHAPLERQMIHDAYSCIKGRGNSYGIKRLQHHLRSASRNYSVPCYALQKDIKGFYVNIDRKKADGIITSMIRHIACIRTVRRSSTRWKDVLDIDFVLYLTHVTCMHNPAEDCIICDPKGELELVPKEKSLRYAREGFGLAPGSLNSGLVGNLFLNVFDHFMKRVLKCRHYGRTADDFYVIDTSVEHLNDINVKIISFLKKVLGLDTNERKTKITDIRQGIRFLGVFIKRHTVFVSNETLTRVKKKLGILSRESGKIFAGLNSYLGLFKDRNAFRTKIKILLELIYKRTVPDMFGSGYERFTYNPTL